MVWVALSLSGIEAYAQSPGVTHVLVIGGLGGERAYTEQFAGYLRDTRAMLVERHGVSEQNIRVLAEESVAGQPFVDAVSTAENIRATFASIDSRAAARDHLYVILFGHGSYDGSRARLNIPREDLTDEDYAHILAEIEVARVVFVNTASASGPFTATLSDRDRVVIAATATGTQRDVTRFPRFFVEALGAPEADLDRDGALSVRELFEYAATRTARSYEETGHLATEHATLEDDGDGEATRADRLRSDTGDGHLAAVTYLRQPQIVRASDQRLVDERIELERAIAETKRRKNSMDEDAYYAELESLFVRLARLNVRLDRGN